MNTQVYEDLFGDHSVKLTKIDPSIFRIRPSSVKAFFDYPSEWYKEHVLKQGKAFEGSTSSVLGTVLHYCYECAFLNKELKKDDVDNAIDLYSKNNPGLFSKEEVKGLYVTMLEGMLATYITDVKSKNVPVYVEEEFILNLQEGYIVRGILDLRYGTVIVDYKNLSKKPTNTTSIPFDYKIQLLCGAKALISKGICIDRIQLVYNIRPTATLPARQFVVTEMITPYDLQLLDDTLQLMVESVKTVKEKPELTHLIFKSMKLKQG